jgi:AcrR family transcriptional regulator
MSVQIRTIMYDSGMAVSNETILDAAARTLASSPRASLADVATAAGISRTTLFTRYATREELLVALARDALDRLEAAVIDAELGAPDRDPMAALVDLTERMIPLGARLGYLLRERALDDAEELNERWRRLDRVLTDEVRRAQGEGIVRPDLPAPWIGDAWFWLVVAAWEGIEMGRIAPLDAQHLVLSTLLTGIRLAPERT